MGVSEKETTNKPFKLKVSVTWGDGPDMLLVNEGEPYMLYDDPSMKDKAMHGYSFEGSFCLNLKEAIELRDSLNMAIYNVKEIEQSVIDYFDSQEKNETTKNN